MWGAVLNTSYGTYWSNTETDGPSQRYNRQFWDAYFYEGFLHAGAINADSHEDNFFNAENDHIRWNYYTTNLFADPYSFFKDPIPCERNLYMKTLIGYKDVLARELITAENVNILGSITDVTFVAGEEIHLLPGFSVHSGAEFKASIDPILYKSDCE